MQNSCGCPTMYCMNSSQLRAMGSRHERGLEATTPTRARIAIDFRTALSRVLTQYGRNFRSALICFIFVFTCACFCRSAAIPKT